MEENCCEAVLNNVLGTLALAEVGAFFRAERFLMISTDKAVQPASVMGATKRVAELAIQYLAAKSETQFASVRFGNVLGSRGSVVPIFLKQIAAGGPITVTDEHMTRYFMTIPDAVRLVLHASSLGTQGDIFMLDMGDPIKIVDLARRLVRTCGLRPDIDIETKFVGARAGEKLHEQLWSEDANVSPTIFPEVFRVSAEPPPREFSQYMRELIEMANERDEAAVLATLERMPVNFRKSSRQIIAA
jgi:FlaA1/EpsC-like NDP-sugar epimerase